MYASLIQYKNGKRRERNTEYNLTYLTLSAYKFLRIIANYW